MQPMEKNVEKQLVVRTFEPDMNALKQTAKQLAHMQDTSLNLYGQAGEVLIVVTARAYAQAAATELTENVAEQFELALGPAAYGRGKGSLAYFTAGELIQSESTIAAADPATGALLAEEFSHTKRGPSVFDFGDGSYNDSRVVAKIKNAVYKYAEEGNAPQIAAARAADGLVEAVESADGLALGVQWHPENLAPEHPDHAAIFTWLVDAAAGGALLKR